MTVDKRIDDRNGARRRAHLRRWFDGRRRSFSWRSNPRPWNVFLAEMLLRRTRASQVERFLPGIMERFPDPGSMSRSRLKTVERFLEPLGLRWRAKNLHDSSKLIVRNFDGRIPLEFELLTTLPGVGPYVAAATIAALSDEKVILIDTNTVRVASRVFGLPMSGDVRRRKSVRDAIENLLGGPQPAKMWWAVLDLAASICLPSKPRCEECPLETSCELGRWNRMRASVPPSN